MPTNTKLTRREAIAASLASAGLAMTVFVPRWPSRQSPPTPR